MPTRSISAPGEQRPKTPGRKLNKCTSYSHPKQQQQRKWHHKEMEAMQPLGEPPERLLVNFIPTRVDAWWWWPVGAHVVEVSRELHLSGFLAERLPDHRRFLWTASHRHVSTVMELVPWPGKGEIRSIIEHNWVRLTAKKVNHSVSQ